jgi:hypothetical protein
MIPFTAQRFGAIGGIAVTGLIAALVVSTFTSVHAGASGTFSFTGGMNSARAGHFSVLLNTRKVLAAGGAGPTTSSSFSPLTSAELFDPQKRGGGQ